METEKAIKELKAKYKTEYLDDTEVAFLFKELEKKEKIINEMAKHCADVILNDNNASLFPYEVYEKAKEDRFEIIKNVKQYFEKKAEE